METIDIKWTDLALGYLLLIIPIAILWYYKTGLIRQTIISVIRMTIQLMLVGIYLGFLFDLSSVAVNILWVLIMIMIANYTTISRSGLSMRFFFIPIFFALLVSISIVDAFFLGVAIRLDHVFTARFLIPITGMIMGNCLRSNIIALNSFYHNLHKERLKYLFYLSCGASRAEALFTFYREAIKNAFNPTIAIMAVMGLISLPGTMTGQIISGSDPTTAIKYQLLFMICIFVASMTTVLLTIVMANRFTFDEYDRFKKEVLKLK